MVPVRAGLTTYNGGEQAESTPNPSKGERVCLVQAERTWISNSSISPGASRVLWPPATRPHACLHIAYCGLRGPLRAIFGHRGPFRAVEEVVLPCAPLSGGVNFIKWPEPNYGVSLGPDIYPVPQRRHPRTGLRNGFIWMTSPARPCTDRPP